MHQWKTKRENSVIGAVNCRNEPFNRSCCFDKTIPVKKEDHFPLFHHRMAEVLFNLYKSIF